MKKYIPYNKLSKKEQKKICAAKRIIWSEIGCLSPFTRVIGDKRKELDKRKCRCRDRSYENC